MREGANWDAVNNRLTLEKRWPTRKGSWARVRQWPGTSFLLPQYLGEALGLGLWVAHAKGEAGGLRSVGKSFLPGFR